MTRRRHPRPRLRGQTGMSLLETLLAMTLSVLVMVPVLGWAQFALREQEAVQQQAVGAAGLGVLRSSFTRDVATAHEVHADPAGRRDPVGCGAGRDPSLLVVRRAAVAVTYTVAPSSDRGMSLWRRACTEGVPGSADETELLGDVEPSGVAVECPGVDPAVEPCRRVQLRVVTTTGRTIVLAATVRADPTPHGDDTVIAAPPDVVLVADPTTGPRGTVVRFSATGSRDPAGGGVRYFWEFGDGTVSEEERPRHRFDAVGRYTVVLTVTSDSGVPATDYVVITVENRPPIAVIAAPADRIEVHRGQRVTFSSRGSSDGDDEAFGGRIVSYRWEFGDGTSSSDPSPTTSFSVLSPPEGFEVRLTVTDDGGLTAQARVRVLVTNRPPSVAISASPGSGPSPLVVNLASLVSDEVDLSANPPLSYSWDLGDGRTSSAANPGNVTYTGKGVRTVRLTVTDDAGAIATASTTVVVNTPPVAAFTLTPTSGRAPRSVSFTNSSTDADGSIVAWDWDFGDGSSASVKSPPARTFTFDDPTSDTFVSRTYTVTLTVTDDLGATSTTKREVTITGAPAPANVRRTGGSASGGTRSMTVAWNSVSTVNSYEVELICRLCSDRLSATTTSTSRTFSGLNGTSQKYELRVRARDTNTGKWGAWSTVVVVTS